MHLIDMVRGEGIYLWDKDGRRYIDGSAGPICVNIGHGVKEVADAVAAQMEQVSFVHSSHFITQSVIDCAEKLAAFAPEGLDHVYFCSGGSEATEAAAKMARQYWLLKESRSAARSSPVGRVTTVTLWAPSACRGT